VTVHQVLRKLVRQGRIAALALCAFLTLPLAAQTPVRVGVYANPPKIQLDAAGTPSGIYVQVIEYAASREGWQVRYVPGTFQQGLDRLERGELDLMVDVAKSPQREARFDFNAEPVLYSWNELYVRQDLRVREMSELQGRSVGVLRGSVQEAMFREAAAAAGVRATVVPFDTFDEAFADVEQGRLDAVIANPFYGQRRRTQLARTAIIFGSYALHFAAPKGRGGALLPALDRHLVAMKVDPSSVHSREFEALMRGQRPSTVPEWVYPGALGALLLVALVVAWATSARRSARRLRAAEAQQRQLAEERMQLLGEARKRELDLQHANEDLQIVSASLSHDLRSPLAAVAGFVGAVRDRAGATLDPDARRLLGRSVAAAQRMDGMVRDLGAMLRVAGQPLDLRPCDITGLARAVLEGLGSHQSGQPDVTIAPGLVAVADPQMMRIALENLIGNAWKFSAAVVRPAIEVGQLADRKTFFVRDNGAGFPMAEATGLFRPFCRLHGVDEFPGSGMGLSIVRRIVLRHGGTIWAESAVGQGATFYFTLGA
jgi:signal transduction histidine kinase